MSVRKSKCLTLHEKSQLIQDSIKGASVQNLSRKYGVAKSTICKIKKQREQILCAVANTCAGPGKRKTLKPSHLPQMEKKLFEWFLEQKQNGVVVRGDMIKLKAKSLNSEIEETHKEFTASGGWLQRFKHRYGIRFLKVSGRKLLLQPEDCFKLHLKHKIEELDITQEQLYKADESALCWMVLPDKIFSSTERIASDSGNERVTFLACTNASGNHKIKPLVIGKDMLPFKNSPVNYRHSKSAQMTSNILKYWFYYSFVPQVTHFLKSEGLSVKALLLLNNVSSHLPEEELQSEDGQITTTYLPPNVTPINQPMDQNVLSITKLFYRISFLKAIIANGSNISETMKHLTLSDAVVNLMCAWDCLSAEMIAKCWKDILQIEENQGDGNRDSREIFDLVTESLNLLKGLSPQTSFETSDVLNWNNVDNLCENNEDLEEDNEKEDEENFTEITTTLPDSSERTDYKDIMEQNRHDDEAVVFAQSRNGRFEDQHFNNVSNSPTRINFVQVKSEVTDEIDIKEEPIGYKKNTDLDLPDYISQSELYVKEETKYQFVQNEPDVQEKTKDQLEQFGELVISSLRQLPEELVEQAQNQIQNTLTHFKILGEKLHKNI